MSAEATLDFEGLLAPISEDAPTGESLREHPELSRRFYEVREARNAAMEAERMLARLAMMDESDFEQDPAGQDAPSPPNWRRVVELAADLLCQHTKDLWVAGWLTEAQTRVAGIAGFRDSMRLCREMSEKYWDNIYPRPDPDDGYAHTVAQLSGLDNSMTASLEGSPMLPADERLNWTNYHLALALERSDPEERSRRLEHGVLPLSYFEGALRRAKSEDLLKARATLVEAREECERFGESLDALCGKDDSGYPLGPPTSIMERALDNMLKDFDMLTTGLLEDETDHDADEGTALTPTAVGQSLSNQPVASRDEALQHLLRVADFFRKTEPHSPVSYALEQAVRWGACPCQIC